MHITQERRKKEERRKKKEERRKTIDTERYIHIEQERNDNGPANKCVLTSIKNSLSSIS